MMLVAWSLIAAAAFYLGDATITSETCQVKPEERHCIIERMSVSRWPHTNRYTFDWRTQRCYLMHWSDYCLLPKYETNNFETEQACYDACSGWAVFKRFRAVNPELVPKTMSENQARTIAVPAEEIEKLPELKENPFKRRICEVFSHDGSGALTFEDFLDMMSVFSESAPRDIKAWYAFRIYDLDDDKFIGREDLLEATRLLTRGELQSQEREEIVASVLDEADVDGDGRLSFMDFEHVVVRAPDFLSTFHIRV